MTELTSHGSNFNRFGQIDSFHDSNCIIDSKVSENKKKIVIPPFAYTGILYGPAGETKGTQATGPGLQPQ